MSDERLEQEIDQSIIDDTDKGSFKVHRRVFTDPKIFALEQERIFGHCWLYVGHETELTKPGDFRLRHIAGRNVIFVRGEDSVVRVLLNNCSHRGTPVCREPAGSAKSFRCPYHAWTYDTSGKLTSVPLPDAYGPSFDKKSLGLKNVIRVESYRGFVFASFDAEVQPLPDYLADAREYLDYVCDQPASGFEILPGTHRYSMRANWKLIVENSVDNYHFVILHQRQVQHMKDIGVKVGTYGANSDVSNGKSLGNGHGVTEHQQLASFGRLAGSFGGLLPDWAKAPLADVRAELDARVGAERAQRIATTNRNVRFYPNLYVLDHISPVIRMITPRAVDYTEIQEWALAPKGENPELRALRIHNNNVQIGPAGFVSPDDVEVLEQTQVGLQNPEMEWIDNSRGMSLRRALSSDEQQMRGMHRHWHKAMTLGRVKHPEDI